MFKKNFIIILFTLIGLSVNAADNFLNSVVIDKTDGVTSVVLRSDDIAKVSRDIESQDRLILTLKGVKQSQEITTLYKNVYDVNSLVVQSNNNDLKLYIEAPDISKANIVFETPNSAPITVSDNNKSESKTVWSILSFLILLVVMYSAKNMQNEQPQKDIAEIIKEREMKLYKNFQKEVATLPSMSYKLKGYRKHVLKGETIRSYESRLSKI